ncbi:MAG: glycosyltransferase [Geminocystis sp.]|nr:glycosyltransferase [Geminocystis sp.]MCX8077311.1 glycosyltransferase [Geminocystis sp.]MDW8115823.1 glycosyltransferase [Geminocystis sp.]HIK37897.1 glycosyltransferase [Geminocystis sp. M7585_C2015_104]
MRVSQSTFPYKKIAITGFLFASFFLLLSRLYHHLIPLFKHLVSWLNTLELAGYYPFSLPWLIGLFIVYTVMGISPQQNRLSRLIIVSVFCFFLIRYLWWRVAFSLNLDTTINSIFSCLLILIEIALIISPLWQFILTLNIKTRIPQAEKMSVAVKEGVYNPTVDIFIPSYNEPVEVIKRTIVACQAIEYEPKRVYLLDDGNRDFVRRLCEELNCGYITRKNRLHAKAGNLNNALQQTSGELIAVFDADFVPTTDFLRETVGFFQDSRLALLQTYQSFYSPDPICRNLGIDKILPTEVDIFSRYYQRIRDSINTAICYGSSFVVRRKHLEEIGGFVCGTLSEDYHTGIRLAAEGYKVIYLEKSLSAGLSAENCFGHVRQRRRWARGTIQTLFIPENPLKVKGLKWWQRCAHLEGIFQWFLSPIRLVLLLLPLAYTLFQVVPLRATLEELINFLFPLYFVQISIFSWLNFRSRSVLMSEVYNLVTATPISIEIIQTLMEPFRAIFRVTPKGIKQDGYYFNWGLASPLIFFFILNLINLFSVSKRRGLFMGIIDFNLIIFWNIYNLVVLAWAIAALVEKPKPDVYQWLSVNFPVVFQDEERSYRGIVTKMCEIGAEITFDTELKPRAGGRLLFANKGLSLEVKEIIPLKKPQEFKLLFSDLSLTQYRQLIKMLFCQPNQWQPENTPNELTMLWLLTKSFFAVFWDLIRFNFIQPRRHQR